MVTDLEARAVDPHRLVVTIGSPNSVYVGWPSSSSTGRSRFTPTRWLPIGNMPTGQ